MPLRKYHYARKSIDKTRLDDDAQVKVETQLLMCRRGGDYIPGNAGTTYTSMKAAYNWFVPDNYKNISKVELVCRWDPMTTSGGIQLFNATDGVAVISVEPGATGMKIDTVDVTTTFKGYTAAKRFVASTKGDGTTAPVIIVIYLRVVVDITS